MIALKRVGGRDVGDTDPKQLIEEWGFRGVEYGNWVKDEEARAHIKSYIEAISDLEDITGLDIKKLHREHGLGIAFGSRGSGKASAHFEPCGRIINLTKSNGDGSVAHE